MGSEEVSLGNNHVSSEMDPPAIEPSDGTPALAKTMTVSHPSETLRQRHTVELYPDS